MIVLGYSDCLKGEILGGTDKKNHSQEEETVGVPYLFGLSPTSKMKNGPS